MIPLNDTVKVFIGGNKDSWGIATTDTTPIILKGMVKYTPSRRKTTQGETVDLDITVIFKGKVDIPIGSEICFVNSNEPDKRYKVLRVYPVKDMAGKTIYTKVVV